MGSEMCIRDRTGRYYEREMREFLAAHPTDGVWQGPFIDRMDYAYAAADLVISRSGACTVSELCLVAKPTIFVPSPNVAEDHQTKNARALADRGAALMVRDDQAVASAMPLAVGVLGDPARLASLSRGIEALAIDDSAERIVGEIVKLIGSDVLPDDQKLTLEIARVIRLGFLQQNAFHAEDTCVPMEKQFKMMETILYLYEKCRALINRGMPVSVLKEGNNIFEKIISIKYDVANNQLDKFDQYKQDIDTFYDNIMEKNG